MARKGENIYKRKDGRWEGRYIKGHRPDGKAYFGYVYGKKYNEVKAKLLPLKYQQEMKGKGYCGLYKLLSDWIICWNEDLVKSNIKRSTYAYYQGMLTRHILPALGEMKLNSLTKKDIQVFVDSLTEKGLGPGTVRSIYQALNRILQKAVVNKALLANPCQDVILPKMGKPKVHALSLAEQKKLEEAAVQDKNGMSVMISLYTGMRIGEICALKWEDVDLNEGMIHVQQTMQRIPSLTPGGKKTEVVFGVPKSENSDRYIPLPPDICSLLIAYKEHADSEYVISCKGSFAEPRVVGYRFQKLLKKAGLKSIHFHALRHTFSTRFMELGVDVTTLSRLLGHASVKMTLDIYTDSMMEHKKAAMNRLNQLYAPQRVDNA